MVRLPILMGFVWGVFALVPAQATTIRSASLDDLIQMSTSVVRGQVVGTSTSMRGSMVYTHYTVKVLDRWKGAATAQVDVQVPGGAYNGIQQNVAGSPQLALGAQYIFFLWTGPSGANLPLGLSQGVLDVASDAAGNLIVERQPIEALALNPNSVRPAGQDSLRMKLGDFSVRVAGALKGGANTQ